MWLADIVLHIVIREDKGIEKTSDDSTDSFCIAIIINGMPVLHAEPAETE